MVRQPGHKAKLAASAGQGAPRRSDVAFHRTSRQLVTAAALLGLLGCTNKILSAFESNVEGTWEGTTTITQGGRSTSGPSRYVVLPNSSTTVVVANLCWDGSGPVGTSTTASSFTLGAITCPAEAQGSCTSVVSHLTGGTGVVDAGTLTMTFQGTAVGCSQTSSFTGDFTGIRQE